MDELIEKTIHQCFPFYSPNFRRIIRNQLNAPKPSNDVPDSLERLALQALLNHKKQEDPYSMACLKLLSNQSLESFEELKGNPQVMLIVMERLIEFKSMDDVRLYLFKKTFEVHINQKVIVAAENHSNNDYDEHWFYQFGKLAFSKNVLSVEFFMETEDTDFIDGYPRMEAFVSRYTFARIRGWQRAVEQGSMRVYFNNGTSVARGTDVEFISHWFAGITEYRAYLERGFYIFCS